jgi:hypothetical protein
MTNWNQEIDKFIDLRSSQIESYAPTRAKQIFFRGLIRQAMTRGLESGYRQGYQKAVKQQSMKG